MMKASASPAPAARTAALRRHLAAAGCELFEPGSEGYADAVRIWNGAVAHEPALVVRCSTVDDVRLSVIAAQAHGFPIAVRGGGHDWAGRALRHGGLVLDLSGMRQVSVNPVAMEATVAGGALTCDVSAAAGSHGLAAVTGNIGAVGMTGLLLGGGYGPLTPRFGLAADNLLGAEIVLADGRLLKADETQHADLFWALRGGGGNFGVVTSMRLRLHAVGELLAGVILFPWTDAGPVLRAYADMMASAPDALSLIAGLSTAPDGKPVVLLGPVWSGDGDQGRQVIARLQGFGTPIAARIAPMSCSELLGLYDAQVVGGRHYAVATRWLHELTPDVISALVAAYDRRTSPFSMITLHHFHGAGTRIAPTATAFGMRREHFTALVYGSWEAGAGQDSGRHDQWVSDLSAGLAPLALPGGYANVLGPEAHGQISAAYGPNAARLRAIKRTFDPGDVFSSAIPLPP